MQCSLSIVISKYLMVLSSQQIRISPDLDNSVAHEKKLDVVHLLKDVLDLRFKTLVSETSEAKGN